MPSGEGYLLPPDKTRRVILCSGQIYYTLFRARRSRKIRDVILVRLEQIAPFPHDLVTQVTTPLMQAFPYHSAVPALSPQAAHVSTRASALSICCACTSAHIFQSNDRTGRIQLHSHRLCVAVSGDAVSPFSGHTQQSQAYCPAYFCVCGHAILTEQLPISCVAGSDAVCGGTDHLVPRRAKKHGGLALCQASF